MNFKSYSRFPAVAYLTFTAALQFFVGLPVAALRLERVGLRRGKFFERPGDGLFMRRHERIGRRREGAVREPGGCA